MAEFVGANIVVTGASSGIGRATALELARRGASVLIVGYRNRDGLERTFRELAPQDGGHGRTTADITDPQQRLRLVEHAWAWRTRIDGWVNFAGADVLTGPVRSWDFERKSTLLWQVDVLGTMAVCREIAPRLADQSPEEPTPAIVNVGWDQVVAGMGGDAGQMFGPIKSAVAAFSLALARSWAPRLRVNVVAPGWIRTAWGEQADPYWDERARRESLAGRWGMPEDVAHAACFLVGPRAAFVNATVLPVNGGFRHEYDPR